MARKKENKKQWVIDNIKWYLNEGYEGYAKDFAETWSKEVDTNPEILVREAKRQIKIDKRKLKI